jgi:hypothetical protein
VALLYADRMTDSMERAIGETERRRAKQIAFNEANGIVPRGVTEGHQDMIDGVYSPEQVTEELEVAAQTAKYEAMSEKQISKEIKRLEKPCSITPRIWNSKKPRRCATSCITQAAAVRRTGRRYAGLGQRITPALRANWSIKLFTLSSNWAPPAGRAAIGFALQFGIRADHLQQMVHAVDDLQTGARRSCRQRLRLAHGYLHIGRTLHDQHRHAQACHCLARIVLQPRDQIRLHRSVVQRLQRRRHIGHGLPLFQGRQYALVFCQQRWWQLLGQLFAQRSSAG